MSYEVFADFYDALTDNVDYAVLSKNHLLSVGALRA